MTTATVSSSALPTDRRIVYAALGDSATAGVGDHTESGPRGWARMLASALSASGHDVEHHVLAREGARAADVLAEQLPDVVRLRPDVVTLLVGGNDVLRGDFDPYRIERDVDAVATRVAELGALLVMIRLHDPTQVVPMPAPLARVIRRRVAEVNVVVDAVASRVGALLVDPGLDTSCYDRSTWHVDRMHPSAQGHARLAGLVAERLVDRGVRVLPPANHHSDPMTRGGQARWMLRNGTPWVLKRSVDLLPALALLTLREAFARP